MSRKYYITLLYVFTAMLCAGTCDAQTKTDLTLLRQADQIQRIQPTISDSKFAFAVQDARLVSAKTKKNTSDAIANKTVRVSAVLAQGAEMPTEKLQDLGIKVCYKAFRNVGLIVPVCAVAKLDSIEEFSSFYAPKKLKLDNKTARSVMKVDSVQDMTMAEKAGLATTYTGEGVVVGVFDTGIDFNHANFRDPTTKQTRIKEAMVFRKFSWDDDGYMIDENGNIVEEISDVMELYTKAADIDTLTTDATDESHGTNTSSIAAGSYTGSYKDVAGNILYDGYQGVAPKTDLVLAGAKVLWDEFQYTALEEMDKYAAKTKKPLVVNLSLGSYTGWFDGKDETSQFYDDFTNKGEKPGRVICVSSGNSSDSDYTIYENLNSGNDHTLYTVVNCTKTRNTSYPYSLKTSMNIFSSSNEDTLTINTYAYSPKEKKIYSFLDHNKLIAAENLYRGMYSDHDGRYMAQLYFPYSVDDSLQLIVEVKSNKDCKVRLINMSIDGEPKDLIGGMLPYTDSDGTLYFLNAIAGNADSSINSSNCTNSIISVGAWVDNLSWKLYSRNGKPGYFVDLTNSAHYTLNDITYFSSYILQDDNGYARPEVTAPGCFILSGYNNYDTDNFQQDGTPMATNNYVCGIAAEEYGRTDGRHSALGAMQGTSQACPNAVGVIALWLQANPELTQNQIKEIIANTSGTDDFTQTHPQQFGYGKINALKGLQYIQQHFTTAIHEVVNGQPKELHKPVTSKTVKDGKLVIIRNGKQYSADGKELKQYSIKTLKKE